MDHAEARGLIEAYADGELDPEREAAFEDHAESCTDCGAALDAWDEERRAVRAALEVEPASARLAARVRATTVETARPRAAMPAWVGQAAALVAVGVISSVGTFAVVKPHADERVQTLIDAHVRAQDPGKLIEVASSDQHTVKPWLDARLDFAPPVEDFRAQGFPLVGGRLDYVDGHRAAVMVYGRRKHLIDVFVRPSGDAPEPPKTADRRGYHLVGWRHGGFDWWAVSDVGSGDLEALHQLIDGEG